MRNSSLRVTFHFRSLKIQSMQNASNNHGPMDLFYKGSSLKERNSLNELLGPKCSLHLAAFNVRMPSQIMQQTALAKTLEAF